MQLYNASIYFLLIFFTCLAIAGESQKWENPDYFISPVDHDIILAGSFAELRTSHFHAGLDIKPASRTSIDTIRCVADGYIRRIKVQSGGYGQAVYIDHPNGYTSVYAHLKKLHPELEAFVRTAQKKAESYSVDVYPVKGKFSFLKGEAIGLMGNTGNSYAKHLHFEIRERKTEKPINPALFGIKPKDTRAPEILTLDLHGLSPEFQITTKKTWHPQKIDEGRYQITDNPIVFPAWRIGICVQAFDKMNGAENNNGVYAQRIFVDDQVHFEYKFDKLDWNEMKYINAHIDYLSRKSQNRTLTKGYLTPGNNLGAYTKTIDRGVIDLFEDKTRKINVEIEDIEGNTSSLTFTVIRSANIPTFEGYSYNEKVEVGKEKLISGNGLKIFIPRDALEKNLYLTYSSSLGPRGEKVWQIGDENLVLLNSGQLTLPIDPLFQKDKRQVVIGYLDEDNQKISLGGTIKGNEITTSWKQGGKYFVTIDNTKPTIEPVNKIKSVYAKNDILRFRVTDLFANKLTIRVELNGHWHIAPYKDMTSILQIPMDDSILPGSNEIKIIAKDDQNNMAEWVQIVKLEG